MHAQAHQWTCKNCSNSYDLAAIEAQLVRAVRLKARAYQLQDLRCTKCRQVCLVLDSPPYPLHSVCLPSTDHAHQPGRLLCMLTSGGPRAQI